MSKNIIEAYIPIIKIALSEKKVKGFWPQKKSHKKIFSIFFLWVRIVH